MIVILGWATILLFVAMCFISGLPEFIQRIDNEILEKHRVVIEPIPDDEELAENHPHLRVVK